MLACALLAVAGCARAPVQKPPENSIEKQVIELQASLEQKEAELARLEALVRQQQDQLREKDAQIQSLKDRLAQLGVF